VPEIIRSGERASFKRCRRAWDLGSRSRRNYEPVVPTRVFDVERAIHDALALYYFPGMWEWDRGLVCRLVLEGFHRSMRKQLDACLAVGAVSEPQEAEWERALEAGAALLERYFRWAPAVDAFSPVRVDTDFEANVPDPAAPGLDLVAPGGGPIHYRGRVDALVVDAYDAYWIVDHRVAEGEWASLSQLLLDEQGIAACWAWEIFYYGMRIAGTIYNEIRPDLADASRAPAVQTAEPPVADVLIGRRRMYMQALRVPEERVEVSESGPFRRTRITRSRAELAACGLQVAQEAIEMTSPRLVAYPSPSPAHCGPCAYRDPCLALTTGMDPAPILADRFRSRGEEEVEEGRLGGVTWSMNRGARPPRLGG
jgi:hypothetical protein